jgi:hypothetical protein
MDQTIEWLRGLAAKGGKGVVDNIDARSLGRIADDLEQLRRRVRVLEHIINDHIDPLDCDDIDAMIVEPIVERFEKAGRDDEQGAPSDA